MKRDSCSISNSNGQNRDFKTGATEKTLKPNMTARVYGNIMASSILGTFQPSIPLSAVTGKFMANLTADSHGLKRADNR